HDPRVSIEAEPHAVIELGDPGYGAGHAASIKPALKLAIHSSIVGRSAIGTMLAASWKRMRSVGASRR
ncbi:hypothetical protein, partial [Stenotrophomonas maltophilia]|uniref:hypothetical protein n=1 Tax=Stenotrophomonas maltophilia TaxID=40324 RepID=UPI001954B6F7